MTRPSYRLAALAGLGLLLTALPSPAKAVMIAPAPIYQRVAQADVVVVGKVTGIEEKTVEATQFPGNPAKVEYHVAVIKIEDHLLGAKALTHIKVGYIVPKEVPAAPPGPGGIRAVPIRRLPSVKFEVDQEVCAFLKKHHDGDFYVAQAYFDVIDKKAADFDKSVEQAKRCAKLLADPVASLKSKDADDRLLTAGMLVMRYRSGYRGPNPKTEAIDADESKLIMKALADADWTKPITRDTVSAQQVFTQLGATEKDGWTWKPTPGPVQPPNAYRDAAFEWVKSHVDTYRIQRLVEEKKEDKKEK
jgi:hypothetical protein